MTPATPPPTPRSRRERPAKPALGHAGIVEAAVRIMRAEGLQRVTMRRLATELDTGPASLYVYFGNTAELHAAILEEYLGAVDLSPAKAPAEAQEDWRERLVQVLGSYTGVLFEHPSLARSALVARPTGANYLALVEAVLALLDEGGVPPGQAAWSVDVLLQLATAAAAEQGTRSETDPAEEEHDALVGALRAASADTYPRIAALGDDLFSGSPQQRLGWMFRVVVNGALATPRDLT
ncbi:TetR/AcrR family transcriptional regulator [Streptomyces sp. NBC_01335]|uniref:TetR/AcrR family transcriptional regulator n=1 Tax=Streptomyces sp. NBC_01335 TaxID=2903828 RepID=UPI002E13F672|nr:TetR/AcrR family transcriptional regulator [Streptomyces sp. NBC_01335]